MFKCFLFFKTILLGAPSEVGVVGFDEFFFRGGDVVDECWATNAYYPSAFWGGGKVVSHPRIIESVGEGLNGGLSSGSLTRRTI